MGEGIKTRRGESQGGVVDFLYNLGDEKFARTGGWERYVGALYGGTVTENVDNIFMQSTTLNSFAATTTTNMIDFTNINKLKITLNVSIYRENGEYFGLFPDKVNYGNYIASTFVTSSGLNTYELDTSSVVGSYYVRVNTAGLTGVTAEQSMYSAWLE